MSLFRLNINFTIQWNMKAKKKEQTNQLSSLMNDL